jgi:hypothetical protein
LLLAADRLQLLQQAVHLATLLLGDVDATVCRQ